MDDLDDLEAEWRPRRIATANTLALGDEARDITVRTFRTIKPFEKATLLSRLRQGRLTDTSPLGVIHYLSDDADVDVRVVIARQGETKVRRYDSESEEVGWWKLNRTILDVVAIRYSADGAGNLKFTMFGGGGVPQPMIDWFHETFADIARGEPKPDSLAPDLVRSRCFNPRFLERLYAVRAQIDAEAYQTIDHTQFKSRGFIDPRCERMKDLRTAERLLIEAFESEVSLVTADLDDEVTLRFLVRTDPGSIRLTVPKLRFRRGLRDLSAVTRAFYDLCERAVAEIVGTGAQTSANLDPGRDDGLFAAVTDLRDFRRYLDSGGNRARFFRDLDLGLLAGHWLPHLRALNLMLDSPEPPADLEALCGKLASEDPEEALRLLKVVEEQGLRRLVPRVRRAVVARYPTMPVAFLPLAAEVLLSSALTDSETEWSYDGEEDTVSALGVTARVGSFPAAHALKMLLRCARAAHARILAEAETADTKAVNTVLARIAMTAGADNREPAALALADGRADSKVVLARLLGDKAKDDEESAARILDLFSLPLWPFLEMHPVKGGWQLTNRGLGTAFGVQAGLLTFGDLPPEGHLSVPNAAAKLGVSFARFGRRWLVSAEALAPGASPAPPESVANAAVPRWKLVEFRKKADPNDELRGDSEALWSSIEAAYLSTRHDGRPHILITGETGTGKSEFARMIHRASGGSPETFIRIGASNFAASGDENIVRGELVGIGKNHGLPGVPRVGKKGYLQDAEGGTLFVDDFDGLAPNVQHALLDVLAGVDVRAVGGDRVQVRCRVMLATNANVAQLVADGKMREDLMQRIDVRLTVPPLRDRRMDILAVMGSPGESGLRPSARAWCALLKHDWPGNVRELLKCWSEARVLARETDAIAVDLPHLRAIPEGVRVGVAGLTEKQAMLEVVRVAAELASAEGYRKGARAAGLGRRVHELTGLSVATVSRMLTTAESEAAR